MYIRKKIINICYLCDVVFLIYVLKLFFLLSFVSINECKLFNILNDEFYFYNRIILIIS